MKTRLTRARLLLLAYKAGANISTSAPSVVPGAEVASEEDRQHDTTITHAGQTVRLWDDGRVTHMDDSAPGMSVEDAARTLKLI